MSATIPFLVTLPIVVDGEIWKATFRVSAVTNMAAIDLAGNGKGVEIGREPLSNYEPIAVRAIPEES